MIAIQSALMSLFLLVTPPINPISSIPSSPEETHVTLYYNPNCYYCKKVLNYMEKEGEKIPLKNTQDPEVQQELVAIGGKRQIPCLVIDGKALYESDLIIEWLQEHHDTARGNAQTSDPQ